MHFHTIDTIDTVASHCVTFTIDCWPQSSSPCLHSCSLRRFDIVGLFWIFPRRSRPKKKKKKKMGNHFTRDHFNLEKYTFPYMWKENYPDCKKPSPYDPLEGFPNGRKERGLLFDCLHGFN